MWTPAMCRAGDSIAHCSERPKSTEPILMDAWTVLSTKTQVGSDGDAVDSQSLCFPHINIVKKLSHGSGFSVGQAPAACGCNVL